MAQRVTVNQFIGRLQEIERTLYYRVEDIPQEILRNIKWFIIVTRTIDTGKLYFAFDYGEYAKAGGYGFRIDTAQDPERHGIEGFVEFDRPAYSFRGRRFIEQGIKASNFERFSNDLIFSTFG